MTVELFKHVTATAGLMLLVIHLDEWLAGGSYARQMTGVPALAIVLLLCGGSYVLALLAYLSNKIYPRTKLSLTTFANMMQLIYLIMLPLILSMELVLYPANEMFGWWTVVFAGVTGVVAVGLSAVVFRTEMLIHGLGVGRTLLAQLPKLPVILVFEALVLALWAGAAIAWSMLPPSLREFVGDQAAAIWKIVSEF
ncbi:MAG: hypothetical protein ABSD74_15745 [Rhizomicrobium sp.]